MKTIIDKAYSRAQSLIINNMDKLHAVAEALLENETISEEKFEEIFRNV